MCQFRQRLLFLLVLFFVTCTAYCSTYFVDPNGNDTTGNGSIGSPYKTITKGVSTAVAGDTIYLRGGTHTYTTTISISKSGTSGAKYYLFAYGSEKPILNFSSMSEGSSNRGINLSGSYWHFKGFDIYKAGDNGLNISSSYNIIELCNFYENRDTGLQIGGGGANNQIINCDSYYNCDSGQGNADGFSPKLDVGSGNYFYGCRSWNNSDDAYDGYLRPTTGPNSVNTTYENCWAMKAGYLKSGAAGSGNGNGFKMGGGDTSNAAKLRHNVKLINCLAFQNLAKGFDQNNNRGDMKLYNCTAFNNGGNNYSIPGVLASVATAKITNSVYLTGGIDLATWVTQITNGWQSPFSTTSADFVSIDPSAAYGARKADGSLPDITFMHLAAGSDLIDSGTIVTEVNRPYNGSAPDLGCFETDGSSLPGAATNPTPANGVINISLTQDLSWTAGGGATSRDVYFGTVSTPVTKVIADGTALTYDTGTMAYGTTYYWRVDEKNTNGTTTGTVWSFTTVPPLPGAASSPSPSNGATSVSLTQDISWTAGADATSRDAYFGDVNPPVNKVIANGTALTYDTGLMATGTTYYWRVDEKNISGTTTGTVWSFTTTTPLPPGAASNPTPANAATNVGITTDLSWSAGSGVATRDVYFGTVSTPVTKVIADGTALTYDTGTMAYSTTYYWRIDEKNAGGTTTGTVWSFSTVPPSPPGAASSPVPTNSAANVSLTQDLSWTAGGGATSHDVYFGTVNPPPSIGNQAGTTYDTGTMGYGTTYYWRIDEKNTSGTTTGTVWNFTTVPAAPGQASSPVPSNGATSVSLTQDISWTAGSGAATRDVYFGTVTPPVTKVISDGTVLTYDTGTMSSSKTYYWRIDEKNAGGTTTGTVWNFTTQADTTAPTPNPMTFATAPNATSSTSITMVATTATDISGVEYMFTCTAGGGHSSAWQSSTSYTDTGLTASTTYTYTVKARDLSTALNETTASSPASATTQSGAPEPAAYWRFNETSGTIAHDVNGNPALDGTLQGTTLPTWTAGKYGNGLTFAAGGGKVYVPSNSTIDFADQDLSVSLWAIQPTSYTGQYELFIKGTIGSGTYPGGGKRYELYRKDATFRFAIDDNTTKSELSLASTNFCITGSWIHIVAVRDTVANQIRLYANGVLQGTANDNTGSISQTEPLNIADGVFTNGSIDDVRIYRSALTQAQITAIYNSPGAASSPSPSNGAANVGITTDLSWTAGSGAASHDVYFGTVNPPPFIQNQAGATYDTGTMAGSATYYWRIDEKNGSGATAGMVWSFTTAASSLPGASSSPSPSNGAVNVGITTDLSWTAGSGATSRDVYFGTVNPPPLVMASQTPTTYDTGTMANNKTYYWRIDEKNGSGTTTGTVWNFATIASVPNVVGQTQAAATTAINGAGLTVGTITSQCSDTVPAGNVISQNPTAGTQANVGSAVNLVVSSGQPSVPNVVGQAQATAIANINAVANISYGSSSTQSSETVSAGDVISQSVTGTVPCGTIVNLVVSSGPCSAVVPDVTGQPQATAIANINAVANISYGSSTTQCSDTVTAGNVISQSATGAVPCGTVVNLVISSGQPVVPCDVIGLTQAGATAIIIGIDNLTVGTATVECSDTVPAGRVIRTIPPCGTEIPCGSSIDLVISSGQPSVPNVLGQAQAAAIANINAVANISYGSSTTQCSETVAAGNVISQSATGTVTCGTVVNLVISSGQPIVPDVTGMPWGDARITLDVIPDLDIGPAVYECSDTVPADYVISQSATGTVTCGTVVNLVISSGQCLQTISGYVTESDTNVPLEGVSVDVNNGGGSDITDTNGYYQLTVDYGWSGTVTPSKTGYMFEPNSIAYTNIDANTEQRNYVGTLLAYKITGYVKNTCLVPIEDVTVTGSLGANSDITDANGYYEIWVDYNWSGTVTPSKLHYTFDPNVQVYTVVLEDKTGQDYIANNIYDLDCDGSIGFGDVAVMSEYWLDTGTNVPGDIHKDGDNIVNFLDFADFATVW